MPQPRHERGQKHPVPSGGSQQQLSRIASNFAEIASCVTKGAPAAKVTDVLEQTRALCERAVVGDDAADITSLLPNLRTALETWQQVWPRLGKQKEFRQAVAREADLWSRRLEALVKNA